MTNEHQLSSRHPESRYTPWAVGAAVLLHALLLSVFIVAAILEPAKLDLAQKPVSARLVRLGQKRDDKLLPRLSAPPPPTARSSGPQPTTFKPRDPNAPSAPTRSAEQTRHDLFKAFDKTAAKHEETVTGDPNGDPEGDSDTAEEGERYFGQILARARRNYGVTKTIPPQELIRLKAMVVLYIGAAGELIKDPEVQVSSGNEQFDQDVIMALRKAAPFGPPPAHLAKDLKTVGVAIEARP